MLFFEEKRRGKNVFVAFLKCLNVKHTDSYSNRYFTGHPHKYNLFGLSKMLSDYGVKNIGIIIQDKVKGLSDIDPPFIANVDSDFAIVHRADNLRVDYVWRGKNISIDREKFNQSWSGVVLLAETTEDSIEPDYSEHRREEMIRSSRTVFIALSFFILGGLVFLSNMAFYTAGMITALLVNLIGLYVGYLLVLKQVNIHSVYADKLCSLFKYNDCNDVLQSKAAKLWGVIGWSEIGLGYFISNVCLILFLPHLMPYLALVNICALPYTLWSIWYQKTRAKQWCPLCLMVMTTLWLLFVNNALFGLIQMPAWSISGILLAGCVYSIPFLLVNALVSGLSGWNRTTDINQEINSLKANEDIFLALLKKQPRFEVDISTSRILFGEPQSPVRISILTNPHCGPCSRMHERVEKLLKDTDEKICVQYLFCSFAPALDSSSKALIACYLDKDPDKTREIYREWYDKGQRNREAFFSEYGFDMEQDEVLREFESHVEWKRKAGLNLTPTVLVNGYKLPDNYKIEDLKYFTDLAVDTK